MIAVKTFDSTGVAPNGRVYATDLNNIQAAAAGLTDLTQVISLASVVIGEAGLILSRFGSGEAQIAGRLRSTGYFTGVGGLIPGSFTTTQRDAIAAGGAPTGIIIYNTTTSQFEWNSGTDGSRNWKPVAFDAGGDLTLTGTTSSLDFTLQAAANYLLTAKRSGDTVPRLAIKEDGTIEMGPGGATARDVSLFRSGAGILSLGTAVKLILGSGGIQFSDGVNLTSLTDSITAAMIAPNAIGSSELADNAVDTNAIQDNAVTSAKIGANQVTLGKIAANAVTANEIAADAVGSSELADNAVDTNAIQANAVTLAKLATALQDLLVPTATVHPYAGGGVPSGWLLCNGQAVSRSTYAALFGVIGTGYGAGDGSSTFNVPDMRGRVAVGAGSTVGVAGNDGLAENQRSPWHRHSVSDPTHSHGVNDPQHSHAVAHIEGAGASAPAGGIFGDTTGSTSPAPTGISINGAYTGISVGTGGPLDGPAFIGMNHIIKT